MSSEKWKAAYGKSKGKRPGISEIKLFLPSEIVDLFIELIDRLIHEFHINLNSGVKGRFVAINLIAYVLI